MNLAARLADIATSYDLSAAHCAHAGTKRSKQRIAIRTRFVRDALIELEGSVKALAASPLSGPAATNAEIRYVRAIERFGDLPQ